MRDAQIKTYLILAILVIQSSIGLVKLNYIMIVWRN